MNFKNIEWYRTGRVKINNGATIVKGTATDWLIGEIKAGDIFTTDGSQFYEIASVTGSSELVLKTQFQGESCDGQAYAIISRTAAIMQTEIAARLEAVLDKWEARDAVLDSLYRSIDITIPKSSWNAISGGGNIYSYCAEVENDVITASMTPNVNVFAESIETALNAGFCTFAHTLDKVLRVYAREIPAADISASLVLLGASGSGSSTENVPIASATQAGIIKAGRGLNIETDGTANVDVDDSVVSDEMQKLTASNEDVIQRLDKIFGKAST